MKLTRADLQELAMPMQLYVVPDHGAHMHWSAHSTEPYMGVSAIGTVFVNDSMLALFETAAEATFALGHEFGHVHERHKGGEPRCTDREMLCDRYGIRWCEEYGYDTLSGIVTLERIATIIAAPACYVETDRRVCGILTARTVSLHLL